MFVSILRSFLLPDWICSLASFEFFYNTTSASSNAVNCTSANKIRNQLRGMFPILAKEYALLIPKENVLYITCNLIGLDLVSSSYHSQTNVDLLVKHKFNIEQHLNETGKNQKTIFILSLT